MAVAYSSVSQFSQQFPPPLLPKPGKDNVRLQKLLKRTAKKKASAQASQSAAPFRSSLSPVNEASPDLEHSDHSTPPQTPVGASSFHGIQQPPRYSIRPLYQHVASPYPQRAAYGRGARFSPQTVAMPSYSQQVTTVPGPVVQPVVPQISVSPLPETTVPSKVKDPALGTFFENHASLKPVSPSPTPYLGPTPFTAAPRQSTRPLTVLTSFVKPKSPRPTFKATEPSRSPRPMFDVPQIRMYTATTSYYEISRTPPVYDTSGLTSIGVIIPQSKIPMETKDLPNENRKGTTPLSPSPLLGTDTEIKRLTPTPLIKRTTPTAEVKRTTPTAEVKRTTPTVEVKRTTPTADVKRTTPTAELKRTTPTAELKRTTPTAELKRTTPTADVKRTTPTAELKRTTPTAELKRTTPTAELKRTTPTAEDKKTTATAEVKRTTPTAEVKRNTATAEVKRNTATAEVKRTTPTAELKTTTPTAELKRTTPTAEVKGTTLTAEPIVKTPTYEFQSLRASVGRPKTPAYHVTRATTPVFEISKPNPLLFSVSPITPDSERSNTKPETLPNGDTHLDLTSIAKPIQQESSPQAKSEPDLIREEIPGAATGSQGLKPTTAEPVTLAKSSHSYQRPMTPTYEANRLMTASPGYKRPKTPTSASAVVFQRPKTPNQVATRSKSGYRGLTPAEYAAFGGIKTYTPAFGISGSTTSTQTEEVKVATEESVECKTFAQEPPVKLPSTAKESKATETFKDTIDEKASITASIPMIIVSSDVSDAKLPPDQSVSSNQVPVKQEKVDVHEMPKAEAPTAEVKTPENQKAETSVQGVTKLNTQTPETKPTLPQGPDQDPLKAVRKLLGKSKPPPAESIASPESKPAEPRSATAPVPEPAESKDKAAPEIKEADESRPTAEPVLKVLQKPKEIKSKTSGWSRLKKHMVVEQEEPKFPDAETGPVIEATGQDQNKVTKGDEVVTKLDAQDQNQTKDAPKATKMWDAVLFQMFSTKENIMYQIELNKSEEEKQNEEIKGELKEIPSFAHRLPVLLFSPKFDAKKLREAASRPVTKISTVFEMGLIGRKGKDEEPKDFNRTARGFINS